MKNKTPQEQMILKVYWSTDEQGILHYDEDSMREEFEFQLAELLTQNSDTKETK